MCLNILMPDCIIAHCALALQAWRRRGRGSDGYKVYRFDQTLQGQSEGGE